MDFRAHAVDYGNRNSWNYVYVNITIMDVNDNPPYFYCLDNKPDYQLPNDPQYPCFYNLELHSNTRPGAFQLQLEARDVDTVTREFLSFSPYLSIFPVAFCEIRE